MQQDHRYPPSHNLSSTTKNATGPQSPFSQHNPSGEQPTSLVSITGLQMPHSRPISMKSNIIRKHSRHNAHMQCSSLTEPPSASNTPGTPSETPSQTQMPSVSPGVLHCPMPSLLPILAPDSTTQPVASHNMSVGMGAGTGIVGTGMGGSSELMGALGDTYAVYNPFPGPYHPDYLFDDQ
ncbi:hypothetical protein BDR05DRAFT_1000807 [Suillus weaverae]|nr:hypothetical protein BDR05DRAFT_1000807 [Suillus weaverae]